MKHILQAKQIEADKSEYFNATKKIYNPIPVFPFLSEEEIDAAIEELIDEKALKIEIERLHEASKTINSTIIGTDYIICLVEWNECPELIKLLTISREWAFRNAGGGVGSIDYDEFDLRPEMKQLIIINPNYTNSKECIIGGYRYIIQNKESYKDGPMGAHFNFSDKWKNEQWIELGRSFTNPYLQKYDKRPSIDFVLHGLGYIFAKNPDSKGYFGKVTLYNIYEQQKADEFFVTAAKEYWQQSEDVYVNPEEKIPEGTLTESQKEWLDRDIFKGMFYLLRNDYQINMVKIMAVYNRLASLKDIYYFGAFRHHEFGDTTEVGIAIHIDDIHDTVKEKFIERYS
ncbi:MAG: hypothetical protein ACPGXZ_07030 [Saprospiraceae bacterium]